jgi:uncharacterized OB-fold protein
MKMAKPPALQDAVEDLFCLVRPLSSIRKQIFLIDNSPFQFIGVAAVNLKNCPNCGTTVLPTGSGECPSCRSTPNWSNSSIQTKNSAQTKSTSKQDWSDQRLKYAMVAGTIAIGFLIFVINQHFQNSASIAEGAKEKARTDQLFDSMGRSTYAVCVAHSKSRYDKRTDKIQPEWVELIFIDEKGQTHKVEHELAGSLRVGSSDDKWPDPCVGKLWSINYVITESEVLIRDEQELGKYPDSDHSLYKYANEACGGYLSRESVADVINRNADVINRNADVINRKRPPPQSESIDMRLNE